MYERNEWLKWLTPLADSFDFNAQKKKQLGAKLVHYQRQAPTFKLEMHVP